ncbi:MAG TPA: DUF6776 family protein [Paenalcaligenes sp.]|nr:DUF6776 family protein [Paenalcaligenes sp.]
MLRSKRPAFKPTAYGYSRRKRRIPRWLVLMLTGVVIGVGGLLFIQTSYGPTRLTTEQSEQLHFELNSANAENQRLQSQLAQVSRELDDAQNQLESQRNKIENHDATVAGLQRDIDLFTEAMPADPRGTSPGIHAANFRFADGRLHHSILVMQSANFDSTFAGQMKLVVTGRYTNGRTGHIEVEPFDISVDRYNYVEGDSAMPEGFTPRQVTIQIFEQGTQTQRATRIINVPR